MKQIYEMSNFTKLICLATSIENLALDYTNCANYGLDFKYEVIEENELGKSLKVKIKNTNIAKDFVGVINFKLVCRKNNPKFFMPGYIYNRNTADKPSSGRKAFPRIVEGARFKMPESELFMTRSDRLAEPVSLIYDSRRVMGISANPYLKKCGAFSKFCGFTCCVDEVPTQIGLPDDSDGGYCSVGYTLGYDNAPWLFVQTATVLDRDLPCDENCFTLPAGEEFEFDMTIFDYSCENELGIYDAIKQVYYDYHESPRKIPNMSVKLAVKLLSSAISDYAWLEEDKMYSGFVFDCSSGLKRLDDNFSYNKLGSLSWTNGLSVATPMLMAADFADSARGCGEGACAKKQRLQALTVIDSIVKNSLNPDSGLMYDAVTDGEWSVKGWWYDGMHSGGHSGYLNGQAVYYILKAYLTEKKYKGVCHEDWIDFVGPIVDMFVRIVNTDYEFPFAMSEKTGAGIEYDSLGSSWCLTAVALWSLVTGRGDHHEVIKKSEAHYYDAFVSKAECYGGPLDTDKAVDNEGILAYIRAVRIMHEIFEEDIYLDHLRDALNYEFSFKLGYNTPVQVRPLSEIGWSSCGGSITSTANPHIHPMSSTILGEMMYYLKFRSDTYVRNRLEDTLGWGLQTFNTKDGEYGYGKVGWMSERFCFCQGLLTEKYPNDEPASTWFALMPWASASIIEGLVDYDKFDDML